MTAVRTFGRLEFAKGRPNVWKITELVPHVAIHLKRMFPKIRQDDTKPILTDTDDVRADLLWFMARYPFETADLAKLEEGAARIAQRAADRDAILLPTWQPGETRGFREGKPPYSYQVQAAEIAMAQGGLLLGDDVGIGKTNSAAVVMCSGRFMPAGVVVQPHLTNQWKRKLEEFTHLKVHIIRQRTPYHLPAADVYIFGYSIVCGWTDFLKDGFLKSVFYDEIQELRHGIDTAKGRACAIISAQAQFRMGLTATPIYNYGDEIHTVMDYINPEILGNAEEFKREWCDGGKIVKDPDALGSYLRETGWFLRRDENDPVVDRAMPKPNIIQVTVPWDDAAAADEAAIARQLALSVMSGSFAERGRAARELDMRMRHMTGVAKARAVAAYVRMLLRETDRVVLVGWHRDVYERWLTDLRDFNPKLYTGSESKAQKDAAVEAFCTGRSRLLILSLRSGAGIDGLQHHANHVVFGELDWSPQVHHQVIGRLRRPGQTKQVEAHYLTSNDGSDPVLVETLGIKSDQSRGVNDPGVHQVMKVSDDSRIKRLAQFVLDNDPAQALPGDISPPDRRAAELFAMLQMLHTGGYGACRWCGEQVPAVGSSSSGNKLWHPDCLQIAELHAKPDVQRRYLVERDGPGCEICGEDGDCEPDFVIPLSEADRFPDIMDRIDLYGPDNLRLRCGEHHTAST
jgi:superfamily II DNA or RNA helicase